MQEKYGATLLRINRGARSIEVTNEGMILYNKAKYLCAIEDSAQREITSARNGVAGKLSISLSPSMSVLFIQNFLSKFSLQNPDVEYELHEVNIQEQTRQLLDGISEIGVANAPLRQASAVLKPSSPVKKIWASFTIKTPTGLMKTKFIWTWKIWKAYPSVSIPRLQ
jgi:DNA-binding transcriptional LysR family regulator